MENVVIIFDDMSFYVVKEIVLSSSDFFEDSRDIVNFFFCCVKLNEFLVVSGKIVVV